MGVKFQNPTMLFFGRKKPLDLDHERWRNLAIAKECVCVQYGKRTYSEKLCKGTEHTLNDRKEWETF